MVILSWVLFLAMLAIGFDRYLEKQTNPNKEFETRYSQNGSSEVRLIQNRQGHYIVSGKINQQAVLFILDTGATTVSLPAKVASRLGLRQGYPETTRTANGDITVYRIKLAEVQLGSIILRNVSAHINPHMKGETVLLGMSFLKQLELTQKDNELTLRQQPRE